MRDAWILAVIITAAVSVGGLLFLFGGSAFHPTSVTPSVQETKGDFAIIAQGENAVSVAQRVNYRITNASQFEALWEMIYSNNGVSIPVIDFTRKEVLAVFDGSHSASGYGVRVNSVKEENGQRVLDISYTEPGTSCEPTGTASSPFLILEVDKTSLPLTHVENVETHECR